MQYIVAIWHAILFDCGWVVWRYFGLTNSEGVDSVVVDQVNNQCAFLDDRIHIDACNV